MRRRSSQARSQNPSPGPSSTWTRAITSWGWPWRRRRLRRRSHSRPPLETRARRGTYGARGASADDMIGLLIAVAALGGGFLGARRFVRRRLRFVDAVRRPAAPLVAGVAATAVALPAAALPLVAIAGAVAVALCVAGGAPSGAPGPAN